MPAPFVSDDPDTRFRFELLDMDKLHYRDLLDWAAKDLLVYLDDPHGHMVGFVHSEWAQALVVLLNDGVVDHEASDPGPWMYCTPDWPGSGTEGAGAASNIGTLLLWAANDQLVALCDYAPDEKPGDGQGPGGNIIGYLHADRAIEVLRILNATDDLHGVFSRISILTPVIRPTSEWGHDEADTRVADHWFWSVGNDWVAVVAEHERGTWWGIDDQDFPPDQPEVKEYLIWQLPRSGTLRFCDVDGTEHTMVIPTTLPEAVRFHGGVETFLAWCSRNGISNPREAFELDANPDGQGGLSFDEAEALGFDGTLRTGSSKFDVAFQPVVSVQRNDAGAVTVTIDWADSMLGEFDGTGNHVESETAEVAAAFLDAVVKANGLTSVSYEPNDVNDVLRGEADGVRERLAGLDTDPEKAGVADQLRPHYEAELRHIEAALGLAR